MQHTSPVARAAPPRKSITKIVTASLIGTTIEWYDFFLYGSAAALVFNKLLPHCGPAHRNDARV